MENKEIFIPISKIKGLDKLSNNLDFQVEKINKDQQEDSFSKKQVDAPNNLDNFLDSEYNIDLESVPSVENKFLKVKFETFLDLVNACNQDLDSLKDHEIIVNSKLFMSLVNFSNTQDEQVESNQLIKGVLIGVLSSIVLFILIKLI